MRARKAADRIDAKLNRIINYIGKLLMEQGQRLRTAGNA